MAELLNKDKINVIAFYLPQFHAIPENDKAYGKGFTEWTNVKKALPLFEGHNQPRVPLNGNYYNLLNSGVLKSQTELAKKYGIFGFCYYHYWFSGKKLLEKPIENMLADKSVDMPYCLCWANENWTRKWDGGNNEVIAKQKYGDEKEWQQHLKYLVDFFKDERYIKIEGKPLFIFYKPLLMKNYVKWVKYFREHIKEYGFEGIVLAVQDPQYYLECGDRNLFDYYIAFEPNYTDSEFGYKKRGLFKKLVFMILENIWLGDKIKDFLKKIKNVVMCKKQLSVRDYDADIQVITDRNEEDTRFVYGMFTDWDNTPRNKNGRMYLGSTPQKFGDACLKICKKIKNENRLNCLFINAWNEWAEGAYLEPDEKNGYAYLENLKEAIKL